MPSVDSRDLVVAYAEYLSSARESWRDSGPELEQKTAELVARLFGDWPNYLPIRKKKVVVASETKDIDTFARPLVVALQEGGAAVFVVDINSEWNQAYFEAEALPSMADILVYVAPSLSDVSANALGGIATRVKPERVVFLSTAYTHEELTNVLADVGEVVGKSALVDLKIEQAILMGVAPDDYPGDDEDFDSEIAHAAEIIRDKLAAYRAYLGTIRVEDDPFSDYKSRFLGDRRVSERWSFPAVADVAPEEMPCDDYLDDLLQRYRPADTAPSTLGAALNARLRLKSEQGAAVKQGSFGERLVRWLGFGGQP